MEEESEETKPVQGWVVVRLIKSIEAQVLPRNCLNQLRRRFTMNGDKLPCEAKTDYQTPAQKFASTLSVLKACGKDEYGRLKPSILRMWANPDEAEAVRKLGDQLDAVVYEKREKPKMYKRALETGAATLLAVAKKHKATAAEMAKAFADSQTQVAADIAAADAQVAATVTAIKAGQLRTRDNELNNLGRSR